MSDIESANWSEAAANNNATPPDGAPEGWAPSTVNDWGRETMAAVKRDWNRRNPTQTSGGAANAQTLTYASAPAGYVQGQRYCFIAGATNTGATTLNVSGLGAKAVQLGNAALVGGEIVAGQMVEAVYDGAQFQILALPGHARGALLGVPQVFTTSGTATYTPTTGTKFVIVEVQGGGASGGGCALTGSAVAASASGGGAGAYATALVTSGFAGVSVSVGAGGAAPSAGNNPGNDGGPSSFGSLVVCPGGRAGLGSAAAAPPFFNPPGAGGGTPTFTGATALRYGDGIAGSPGMALDAVTYLCAAGAPSLHGGNRIVNSGTTGAAGAVAASWRSGGQGGANAASQGTAKAGGAGFKGFVIVWEFG
jgi:hypothetical protein